MKLALVVALALFFEGWLLNLIGVRNKKRAEGLWNWRGYAEVAIQGVAWYVIYRAAGVIP